jgi:hypothetical protein
MKECPACAGPTEARKTCATCNGKIEVTQQVFDSFMVDKARQQQAQEFWSKVQEYTYQTGKFKFQAGEDVFELNN